MVWGSSFFVSAVSGGKSTMRNTVPPRGGMIPISMAARSAAPDRSAGVWSVTHNRRDTVCACGRTFLCGLAPSSSTTALSSLSIVVTTRRTSALKAMFAFLPGLADRHEGSMKDHATARGRPPEGGGMVAMRLYRLGVDEHEGETGRLVGAIAPGMVGTALDQDVPRSEQHLALVHHRVDFARQHDGVVHRAGHQRVHARLSTRYARAL